MSILFRLLLPRLIRHWLIFVAACATLYGIGNLFYKLSDATVFLMTYSFLVSGLMLTIWQCLSPVMGSELRWILVLPLSKRSLILTKIMLSLTCFCIFFIFLLLSYVFIFAPYLATHGVETQVTIQESPQRFLGSFGVAFLLIGTCTAFVSRTEVSMLKQLWFHPIRWFRLLYRFSLVTVIGGSPLLPKFPFPLLVAFLLLAVPAIPVINLVAFLKVNLRLVKPYFVSSIVLSFLILFFTLNKARSWARSNELPTRLSASQIGVPGIQIDTQEIVSQLTQPISDEEYIEIFTGYQKLFFGEKKIQLHSLEGLSLAKLISKRKAPETHWKLLEMIDPQSVSSQDLEAFFQHYQTLNTPNFCKKCLFPYLQVKVPKEQLFSWLSSEQHPSSFFAMIQIRYHDLTPVEKKRWSRKLESMLSQLPDDLKLTAIQTLSLIRQKHLSINDFFKSESSTSRNIAQTHPDCQSLGFEEMSESDVNLCLRKGKELSDHKTLLRIESLGWLKFPLSNAQKSAVKSILSSTNTDESL